VSRLRFILGMIAITIACAGAYGQDLRMANGVILKGAPVKASENGLDVQTATGVRTIEWNSLAPSTRYRHEPLFKANYGTVLEGLPSSARTNIPEQVDEQTETNANKESESQTAVAASAAPSGDPFLFDQLVYERVNSFFPGSFPVSELAAPETARFYGFQYGPAQGDVVYLAFDARGSKDVLDTLVIYTPSNPAYRSAPLRITGFKKTTSDAKVVTFKKVPLTTQIGGLTAAYELECASQMYLDEVAMTLSVQLAVGDSKCRFNLLGAINNFAQGQELIPAMGILDMPVLSIRLVPGSTPGQLAGSLTMSGLSMVPQENINNRLTLEVISETGETVQKESIKLDDSASPGTPSFLCDLKKTAPEKTYTVKASLDLGPFLGTVVFEDTITTPKS